MFDEVGHNLMFEGHWTYGDPDGQFASAARTNRWRFTQHRQCNAPLEGRAGLVDHDPDSGDLTYHAAHQNPHALRLFIADLLGLPAHRFHVRTADVGGSFGQKAYISREDVAVCAAGMLLGRPVKWVEDRVENLQAAGQAREERFDVEAAYDDDGTVRAVRVDMVFDQGAYQLTNLPPTIFPTIVRVLFPGAYRLRDLEFRVRVVATNKATYVAYRGPWEAETFVRERMLDEIAADVGAATRGRAGPQPPHRRRAPDPSRDRRVVRTRHCPRDVRAPRWRSPTRPRSGARRARHAPKAACSASAARRSSSRRPGLPTTRRRSVPARRPAARSAPPPASSPTDRSPCSPASHPTVRVTTPRWRSSRPTSSACRSTRSASSAATRS